MDNDILIVREIHVILPRSVKPNTESGLLYYYTKRREGHGMAGKKKTVAGKLTRQQEMFVQAIMAGHGQSEAYKIAYPKANNWTPGAVATEAHRMMKKPQIAARLEELQTNYQKHLEFASFYDRDQLLYDFLYLKEKSEESIDDLGVRQANSNAYVNALKNIGELLDLYPDKKVDLNANISSDFEINILGDGGNGAEGGVDAIESTCNEVDEVLELDEPVIELDLIFPPLEKEPATDEVGDDDGGAKA